MLRPAILLAAALVFALAAALVAFPDLARDPHNNDFTAFWAAGRLVLDGKNPYDAANLLAVERTLGWQPEVPLMIWNPPWFLSVLMAFGSVDFVAARSVWLVFQLMLTLGCAIALWRFYRGPSKWELAAVLVASVFAPLFMSMKYGQFGPLCLLGLTAFLELQERRRDFLAGLFLSLATMKPHLVYMVWPALLVWSIASRRIRVLLGFTIAFLAFATIPLLPNPHVYGDFLGMVSNFGKQSEQGGRLFITDQDSPTFGWQLRLLFGKEHFKLQYVPTLLGIAWLAWYGYRHRHDWKWSERLPVLLLASLSTAAYGSWMADSLLLLPAVIAVAAKVAERSDREKIRLALVVFAMLTLVSHVIEHRPTTEMYVWVPPAMCVVYWYFMKQKSPP
jgi:hypothetical protein